MGNVKAIAAHKYHVEFADGGSIIAYVCFFKPVEDLEKDIQVSKLQDPDTLEYITIQDPAYSVLMLRAATIIRGHYSKGKLDIGD